MAKPISDHSEGVLRSLKYGPCPRQEINNGAVDRLMRSNYIHEIQCESPYKVHKGKKIPFVELTEKGRKYLEDGI